ncbi:MAG: HzsA-related protein [Thermoguttaceae bacterium]
MTRQSMGTGRVAFIVSAWLATAGAALADESNRDTVPPWSVTAANRSIGRYATGLETQIVRGEPGKPLQLDLPLGPRSDQSPYKRLEYSIQRWYESTFWTGPDWTRIGDRWHHPGERTPSIRSFEVPRDGRITIGGPVFKLHLEGDGIRAAIHHNDRQVWSAEIEGADARGVDPDLALLVRQGDWLRFAVAKRGAIACDTTGWDPVIVYEDGESFQASRSFGKEQGGGHWFYEMESAAAQPKPAPILWAVDGRLAVHRFVVEELKERFSSDRWLPFFVATDGHNRSCLAVLITSPGPWSLAASFGRDQTLAIQVRPDGAGEEAVCELAPRAGPWTAGLDLLRAIETAPAATPNETAWRRIRAAHRLAVGAAEPAPEADLLLAVQDDWLAEDRIDGSAGSYRKAIQEHLDRASALLIDRAAERTGGRLPSDAERLVALRRLAESPSGDLHEWSHRYLQTRLLKRRLLLGDARLEFDRLLFCKRKPPSWSHLVAQYYGWRQRPGGGLFLLERPGYSTTVRDLLGGQLPHGNLLEPRVSADARRVVFSFVACEEGQSHDPADFAVNEKGPDDRYFHVYEAGTDGSNLRQLTRGCYDDLMPTYLADGDIAFCSTRRQGYSRCFGPEYSDRWDSYTLHRMSRDGSGIRRLSANDVNEWFPSLSNQGELLFARWDYIDRDAVTHENLWGMRPDGTNPIAVWGNAVPKPHCMFQAKAIPGSGKIVFIASAHHAITAGPVCVVDPAVDRNADAALRRITPGPFPEAESSAIPEYYESPWPLGEDLFLVAYSRQPLRFQGEHVRDPNPDNALGLYVIDDRGNRELIYRDPLIGSTSPTPLTPRPAPPLLPSTLVADSPEVDGEMVVTNVYEGLGDVPPGTIERLRIIQIFPKSTPLANEPRIGFAGEENGRAILGTVPVEADGSARFLVPAHVPVYFQALDADGMAYQTMRSSTHVQPGERIACVGCHEHAMTAPRWSARLPLALGRGPSAIEPGPLDGRPFSYVETVQPVLDRLCVRCHNARRPDGGIDLGGEPLNGFTRSYWALAEGPLDWQKGAALPPGAGRPLVPRFAQRNQLQTTSPGGSLTARGSRLIDLLRRGHEGLEVPRDDMARLATWIDMNGIFFGVFEPEMQQRQLRGELVAMPPLQ